MSHLGNLITEAIKTALRASRSALPGRIVSYDSALTYTADVEIQLEIPLMKLDGRNEVERGQHEYESLPILHGVPVGHPRGGGFFVHFPMVKGDFVWVMFSDLSMDEFIRTGTVSKPKDIRSHDLFPYALPASDPSILKRFTPASLPSDELVIGREGGSEIRFKQNDEVHIAGGAEFLSLSNKVDDNFATLLDLLQNWTVVGTDGGAALQVAANLLTTPTVAASKVKGT